MSMTWQDPESREKRKPQADCPLFEQAHARRSDLATSHQAAASVTNLGRVRDAILGVLRLYGPQTDEGIAAALRDRKFSPSGLRSRRSELVAMGFIEDSGKTAATVAGRQSTIWRLCK